MTIAPLLLESRDCPAVWYGGEVWVGTHSERVFEGWHGSVVSIDVDGLRYVGAGGGGGPRVGVFDLATGDRVRPDYWAGDPSSRAGVAFVVPAREEEGRAPPPDTPVDVTYGPADAFTIFVDDESDRPAAFVREMMTDLHALLPGVRLTTVRPDDFPTDYGTAVYGSRLSYTAELYPSVGAGGIAPADWTDAPRSWWESEAVYVDDRYIRTPRAAARMLAHEIGHGLGVHHQHGEPWDRADLVAAGLALALSHRRN